MGICIGSHDPAGGREPDGSPHNASMLRRRLATAILGLLVFGPALLVGAPSRKSPHIQIVGEGTVETVPKETVHKNGRRFLEFEVRLVTARPAANQSSGADRALAIDTVHPVKVVHDLSCGGAALRLEKGDRIEIAGEYVHVPKGGDLIHFTHPADGSCGTAGGHPSGYLRRIADPRTAAPTPRPVSAVPDQPYRGTPPPAARPYASILAAKRSGATDAELLARVEREGTVYSLTTAEIQELRSAGVSASVVEALLRSGRTPRPAATATPR
jgi:hypothetical protein